MYKNNNYAFIDAQNLILGFKDLGWKLDLMKLRRYLDEKYKVTKAFYFIGYIEKNKRLYKYLETCNYELVFRITTGKDDYIKGNVDVDLTVKSLIEIGNYNKAIVVTSDGDFYPLIQALINKDKLEAVLSVTRNKCSRLLRKAAKDKMRYLEFVRPKIEQ